MNVFIYAVQVLQVIYWSRNGLSLNEIALVRQHSSFSIVMFASIYCFALQEISLSYCEISFILYELLRRDILFFCGGLYYIPNIQVC